MTTITEAAEKVRLALETLASRQGRYCEQPLSLIADVAGVSEADARWGLKRLHRQRRVYLSSMPLYEACERALILLPGCPWPEHPTDKDGDSTDD